MVAFSSLARILGECRTIHSPPVLFSFFFSFFFLKWRLARALYFHALGQDQSTVAQLAETTVAECSLTSCMWARSRIGSHTMPEQPHSQPTPTSLGQGVYACLGITCHLHFLAEWPGSFTFHCGNKRLERTPNKNHHTKLTLERKILQPLLPGFELATFRSRVRRSTNRLSRHTQVEYLPWSEISTLKALVHIRFYLYNTK